MRPKNSSFPEIVADELVSMLNEHGLELRGSTASSVRFGSDNVLVDVYYDEFSYEIGLCITWPGKSDRSFSLSELLKIFDHPVANEYRNYAAVTLSSVASGLKEMAVLLKELFGMGLRFDQSVYEKLVFQARKISNAMGKGSVMKSARSRAKVAWEKKDYAAVVLWLSSIADDLSESERRKLDYARNKLA